MADASFGSDAIGDLLGVDPQRQLLGKQLVKLDTAKRGCVGQDGVGSNSSAGNSPISAAF